ncbi:hypothetical protein ADUPG1_007451 [Aduncisulcus paluster]|uniref:Flagellar hook-associated protein 2 N-terminal domain-containing protein n=1 Tax=Aduncisulcus paluster TaxID=2918883 RepID=A0ABQ5KM72_9EUKA|nr:hypothetical protein ADUPG1_007451 [Aduncisulcus paluster]
MKIDNAERAKTRIEWEQEAYRDVTKTLTAFQDEYFDLLKSETNFRSVSAFGEFNESVTVAGEDVNYLSITGTAGIKSYEHTVGSITQLATEDEWNTDATGIGSLKSGTLHFGSLPSSLEFSLTIDGNTKTISIADTSAITDKTELATALNDEIKAQFGDDYSNLVTADAGSDAIGFRLDGRSEPEYTLWNNE